MRVTEIVLVVLLVGGLLWALSPAFGGWRRK
jgi:hypothetical protein